MGRLSAAATLVCGSVSRPIDSAAPKMSRSDEKTMMQTRERRRLRVAEGDSDGEQNYTAGGPVVGRMGRGRGKGGGGGRWVGRTRSGKKELRIRGFGG